MPVRTPAPELPVGPRAALIIATSAYDDPALARLRAPAQDAVALAGVLGDPRVGGFDVTSLRDPGVQRLRVAVEEFVTGRGTDDLVLVYLSCHGVLDRRGRLYFAASDTRKNLLAATGLEADWLTSLLDGCRARRQILVLDCCFSGAFARGGAKGEDALGLERRLVGHGRGRVVLTASRAGEYSFEGEPLPGTAAPAGSVFTTGLVEGLRTGDADTDLDGLVSVEDAYAYAAAHVGAHGAEQTPQRWLYGAEGSIWLARNPAGIPVVPAELPDGLGLALESPHPAVRAGAVTALGEWLLHDDPARALAARLALVRVADTDVPSVARAARAALAAAPDTWRPDGPGSDAPAEPGGEEGPDDARPYERALADLTRAVELDPDDHSAVGRRAVVLRQMGRYEEALVDLDRAIGLESGEAWLFGQRSVVYRLLQRYDEALSDVGRAIELGPEDGWLFTERGELMRNRREFDRALKDFDRGLELDAEDYLALGRRGMALRQLGRYEEALADLDRAIAVESGEAWLFCQRSVTRRFLHQYDQALADADRAIELDPKDAWLYTERGEAQRSRREFDQALKDFDHALELDPDHYTAWGRRGLTLRQLRRLDEALVNLNRAVLLESGEAWLFAQRGIVFRMLRRYTEALADLDRAIELDPGASWVFNERGETLRLLRR